MCIRQGVELHHKNPNNAATESNAIWLCKPCHEEAQKTTPALHTWKKKEEFSDGIRNKMAKGLCQCQGCPECLR